MQKGFAIEQPDEITPTWLTQLLRKAGHLERGEVTSIRLKEPFESRFARFIPFSARFSNAAFQGASLPFILKLNHDALWGKFEAIFYDEFAPSTQDAAVTRCYDVTLNNETGSYATLLQDLSETHSRGQDRFKTDLPTQEQCQEILGGLLNIHIQWWDHPRIAQADFMVLRPGNLRMSQAATPDMVRQNCREFFQEELPHYADKFRDKFPQTWREKCEKALIQWSETFIRRIARSSDLTLIHADTHRGNVMLPKQKGIHRPIWIDWQTYVRGLPPCDLAYWLWTSLPVENRRVAEKTLLRWYHDKLVEQGISSYAWDNFLYDYRLSVTINLFSALKWMVPSLTGRAIAAFDDWDCMEAIS